MKEMRLLFFLLLTTYARAELQSLPNVYVTNQTNDFVFPINTNTNTISGVILTQSNPYGIAVTPDGSTLYVANTLSNSITIIDAASNTVTGTINSVGTNPEYLAITPDGLYAYVVNVGDGAVVPITLATNAVGAEIPVGSTPQGIAITPDGSKAYVANSGSANVSVITIADNVVTATIVVPTGPQDVIATPTIVGNYVVVSQNAGTNLSVISTESNTIINTIDVGEHTWDMAITPDGSTFYASCYEANEVAFTTGNLATITTINSYIPVLPTAKGIGVTPDGTKVYVVNNESNTVTPITVATNNPGSPIFVGINPIGVAFASSYKVVPSANEGIREIVDEMAFVLGGTTTSTQGAREILVEIAPLA